jgi:hypothetical protein
LPVPNDRSLLSARRKEVRLGTQPQLSHQGLQPNWSPELDKILKSGAAGGPSKLQRAIQTVRQLGPQLSERKILKRTAELKLTNWNRPWSATEKAYVLGYARELSVIDIARNLGRTPSAVYQLLSRNGESAKVQDGYTQGDLAQIFHVSPRKVHQWISLGWLTLYHRRIKDRAIDRFLKEHGDEIDASRIDKEFRLWFRDVGLRDHSEHSREWSSTRQQSFKEHICGRCGRKVRGNAFYRHSRACINPVHPSNKFLGNPVLN